ncbi:MAG: YafY family protein [Anaerolineae bacterium]
MRADRLLSLLLMLQTHGRLSAPELAEKLEVSVRTVYRDVDALTIAGIPIYTNTGRSGGIELDEDYRMALAGLSSTELHTLIVTDTTIPLQQLGLGDAGQTVLKLLGMVSNAQRRDAQFVRDRLFIDPTGWFGEDDAPYLARIQQAVWQDRCVSFSYYNWDGQYSQRTVNAYALVFKSGSWYFIGERARGEMRIYRVSRMFDVVLLAETFNRDLHFDMQAYWQETSRQFLDHVAVYEAVVQATPAAFNLIRMFFPNRYSVLEESTDHLIVRLRFSGFEDARSSMLSVGAGAQVLEPDKLREAIVSWAQAVVQSYAQTFEQAERVPTL